jgi:hypothetical protein
LRHHASPVGLRVAQPRRAQGAKTGETSLPIHMSNSLRPSARHASAISRRPAPELCCIVPPSMMRGRREGRASADAHGPRAAKKHAAEPQVQPRSPGLPCAMVLTLIRDLPGDRLSCPRHPRCSSRGIANLASAPGCQDHTISPSAPAAVVCRRLHVHRSPPPRS